MFAHLGNVTVDQVLYVFLSTAMFVAGFVGFVLDNLAPGKYLIAVLCYNMQTLQTNKMIWFLSKIIKLHILNSGTEVLKIE